MKPDIVRLLQTVPAEATQRSYELKWLRSLAGCSVARAAELMKVELRDYAEWERGRYSVPPEVPEKLAKALGMEMSDIPWRVIGHPPFPPHPFPAQLRFAVDALRAFAEHRGLEIDNTSVYKLFSMVEQQLQPIDKKARKEE